MEDLSINKQPIAGHHARPSSPSSLSEFCRWSKKASRYHGHSSFQSPLWAVARHCWSAIISSDSPHCSISSLVWWIARLYSPPDPSCITRNSQLPRLLRRSNWSTVHLNHFVRKTREVSPCEMMMRLMSESLQRLSLFISMSLHIDSMKAAAKVWCLVLLKLVNGFTSNSI